MDFYWNRENFATKGEAEAFVAGLNWGDEPAFTVDGIEECSADDARTGAGSFDVVFARTEEYEEMQAEADGFWNSRKQADALLTPIELDGLHRIADDDGKTERMYELGRGAKSGHAFANNGESMVYDLTAGENVDADTIEEADGIVAGGLA